MPAHGVLWPAVRAWPEKGRVPSQCIAALAIVSVMVLALTGCYSGWLHDDNLIALRKTDDGQTLLVTLLLHGLKRGVGRATYPADNVSNWKRDRESWRRMHSMAPDVVR